VIVSSKLDLESEVNWPGTVNVGTRVTRIGTSSLTIEQALSQDDRRLVTAATVIVQIDQLSRQAIPLAPETVMRFEQLQLSLTTEGIPRCEVTTCRSRHCTIANPGASFV
jgi:acyl-CoA thioester hydrolase